MEKQFKKFIREYGDRKNINKEYNAFTRWYSEIRSSKENVKITEGGDGGIDFVVETPTEIILCQTKYGKTTIDKVRAFVQVINAWDESENSFENWLSQVKNSEAIDIYKHAYRSYSSKKITWEFVYLGSEVQSFKRITASVSNAKHDVRIVSKNDILYYFSLDKIGASYVDTLRVKTTTSSLNGKTFHPFGEIKTTVCMVSVQSIVKSLRKSGDWERVLSRNVRVRREKSKVNEEIQNTFINETDAFFYGNNGIHIISSNAYPDGDELVIEQPAIINGGQTISTLMNTTRKPQSDCFVLARVTTIAKENQIKNECSEFIDDIIVRSNSSNKMEPWDLRSNDSIQVDIAKLLFDYKIYYERKINELKVIHRKEKPSINYHLDITDLAEILACTSSYGPAKYRKNGPGPLFQKQNNSIYDDLFNKNILFNGDYVVSKIKLNEAILAALKKIAKKKYGKHDSFPKTSKNYILSLLWTAINHEGIQHPLRLPINKKLPSVWAKSISGLVENMFQLYKKDIKAGVTINDIFRTDKYYDACNKRIRSGNKNLKNIIRYLKHLNYARKY